MEKYHLRNVADTESYILTIVRVTTVSFAVDVADHQRYPAVPDVMALIQKKRSSYILLYHGHMLEFTSR